MNGTLELNGTIPAKLIIGNMEFDVEIVSQSHKQYEHKEPGIINRLIAIEEVNTFTCVQRKYREC
jgi:hypothetical protein